MIPMIPAAWLNLASVLGDEFPRPWQLHRDEPISLVDLASRYSDECARIELLQGDYARKLHIAVPEDVMEQYRKYRPTPLVRARGLEKALGYSGAIFYKREDLNPSGSHKPNTAIPQAWYARQQNLTGLITDTGAGQWGAALAWACRMFGLSCTVFMTRNSYVSKPYRRHLMALSGARVIASPSDLTEQGRQLLREDPQHRGSLGIGMGEAMELVSRQPDHRLALGCMSYYAAMHQTVVGQELLEQARTEGLTPDALIGCVGGGTNFFGFTSPWLLEKLRGHGGPELIAAESQNVPALTRGQYRYDYADSFRLTPRVLMYTLGHEFVPPAMHSGGLRYHGKSPVLSLMVKRRHVRAMAIAQQQAFEAGRLFFEAEGVLPAPESNHAIAALIAEIKQSASMNRNYVFLLSGTGYLDLPGYAESFNLQ